MTAAVKSPLSTPIPHRKSYGSIDATPPITPGGTDRKTLAVAKQNLSGHQAQESSPSSDSETSSLDSANENRKFLKMKTSPRPPTPPAARKGILRNAQVPTPPAPIPSNCEKYCACLPKWALRMAGVTTVALIVLSTMYPAR